MTTHRFLCGTLAIAMALGYGPAMSHTSNCQIINAKYLGPSLGAEQLCERFMTQLSQATGNQRNLSELTIVIEVTKEGGLHANLTEAIENGEGEEARVGERAGEKTLPPISVEVMDRDLKVADLDKLAQTVGKFLVQEGN